MCDNLSNTFQLHFAPKIYFNNEHIIILIVAQLIHILNKLRCQWFSIGVAIWTTYSTTYEFKQYWVIDASL